jgi:SAM-dependent methyltransferase
MDNEVNKIIKSIYIGIRRTESRVKFLLVSDAALYGIKQFMSVASKEVKKGDMVLDAGAGLSPYRSYFEHATYESADICGKHTYLCQIEHLPFVDNSYDVIINTQVIEHVESPVVMLKELRRVLKPNGKLFLTAPQGYGIHSDNNYFNFLEGGLRLLFEEAGFNIKFIKPLGGMFWMIGGYIRLMPWYIYRQYLNENYIPSLKGLLLLPFLILAVPICRYLIPWLCFLLDRLDKKQWWTLDYGCYAVKPSGGV